MRRSKPLPGHSIAFVAAFVATSIIYRGVIPVEGFFYYPITLGITVTYWLPFFLDRLLHHRLPKITATLVLPVAFTIVEYINTLASPYGAWGGVALTQIGHPALIQIASLSGRFGITFLVLWFASVVNMLWEDKFDLKTSGRGLLLFTSIMSLVLIFGNARLFILKRDSQTVRTAAICPEDVEKRFDNPDFWDIYTRIADRQSLSPDEEAFIRRQECEYDRELYQLTEREARAGSRIVVWGESSVFLFEEDEEAFKDRYRRLVQQHQFYLLTGVFIIRKQSPEPFHNTALLFEPDGSVRTYVKSIIVPGDLQHKGDGNFFSVSSPYGEISALICFDQISPNYVRRFRKADILLVPADDWQDIDPYFTQFMKLYAIEYGFNTIRSTIQGLSAAYDHKGSVISQADYFTTSPKVLVAQVPTEGLRTPYSVLGDWFVYICMVGFVLIIVLYIRNKTKSRDRSG